MLGFGGKDADHCLVTAAQTHFNPEMMHVTSPVDRPVSYIPGLHTSRMLRLSLRSGMDKTALWFDFPLDPVGVGLHKVLRMVESVEVSAGAGAEMNKKKRRPSNVTSLLSSFRAHKDAPASLGHHRDLPHCQF